MKIKKSMSLSKGEGRKGFNMMTNGSSDLVVGPRLSWTLLSTIPKKRLLRIARRVGHYENGMWGEDRVWNAVNLQHFEKEIVGELTACELSEVARQLGISLDSRRKGDIVQELLKRERIGAVLRKYDGLPDELKDKGNRDLRTWAEFYIRSAEEEDYICNFYEPWGVEESNIGFSPEGTIRLVSELCTMLDWPHLLAWQTFEYPERNGPWWIFGNIMDPFDCWYKARMILHKTGVWDFPFSCLFRGSDLMFEVWKPNRKRITEEEHKWLAGAILDGLRWDYDDSEFVLACEKSPDIMLVEIYPPSDSKEHPEDGTPGEDGICWRYRKSKFRVR